MYTCVHPKSQCFVRVHNLIATADLMIDTSIDELSQETTSIMQMRRSVRGRPYGRTTIINRARRFPLKPRCGGAAAAAPPRGRPADAFHPATRPSIIIYTATTPVRPTARHIAAAAAAVVRYYDIRAGPICHTPSGRIPTPDVDQSTVADNARAAHGYNNIIIILCPRG